MPRNLSATDADLVTRACLGAICGTDGPTDEQLTILRALTTHLWQLPDPDLSPEAALTAEEAAAQITDERLRRRTRELMVLLELCRHPLEEAHAQRVEEYCYALGGDGPGMAIVRDYVSKGAEAAVADWMRRFEAKAPEMMEPEMIALAQTDESEAAARFAEIDAAVRSAAPGTLGAEFAAFYDRNGFTIGPQSIPLFGHDMAHVIGGYDATPIGEICIGAMKLMVTDSDIHWLEFLGSVIIHETGILLPGYEPGEAPLKDPANVELVMVAMERGRATRTDFSNGDHLSMIDWPYADVLEHFGVPPLTAAS
ncbi:MAG: hypothetical protein ACKOA9_14395 [Actinomycetota bacterium]